MLLQSQKFTLLDNAIPSFWKGCFIICQRHISHTVFFMLLLFCPEKGDHAGSGTNFLKFKHAFNSLTYFRDLCTRYGPIYHNGLTHLSSYTHSYFNPMTWVPSALSTKRKIERKIFKKCTFTLLSGSEGRRRYIKKNGNHNEN